VFIIYHTYDKAIGFMKLFLIYFYGLTSNSTRTTTQSIITSFRCC